MPFRSRGGRLFAVHLGAVFALFMTAMHVIDRTVTDVVAPVGRLVSFDDWSHDRGRREDRATTGSRWCECDPAVLDPFEPRHRRRTGRAIRR
jgi:hypothetical protein